MDISGIVVYEEVEGGVWGIVGDDGVRYQLMNDLPKDLRQPGLHVSAEIEPANAVTIFQWGRPVNVRSARADQH